MITFGFRNKYNGLIRAAVAIVIGLFMIISPGTSLNILVMVLASLIVAAALVSAVGLIVNRKSGVNALQIFNIIVELIAGVLIFCFPGAVASFITILIGIVLVLFGLFQIISMASAISFVTLGFWTFLLPVICTVGGVILLIRPFSAAATVTLVTGIAVLIYGISELLSTWKMSKAIHEYEIRFPSSDEKKEEKPDYSDVKDAEFEKAEEE